MTKQKLSWPFRIDRNIQDFNKSRFFCKKVNKTEPLIHYLQYILAIYELYLRSKHYEILIFLNVLNKLCKGGNRPFKEQAGGW
ncbi:hypothetical protein BSQ39_09715 [Loigolactobacillus backii]|nr:hypothetical protein BSQ39_09715 [Loigolactobacillus backii]